VSDPRRPAGDEPERYLASIVAELTVRYEEHPPVAGLPRVGLALRTRLLDAPASVAAWLTAFVAAAPASGLAQRRDIAQAVQLLGALHAVPALPVLFRLAVRLAEDLRANPDVGSVVYGALAHAFCDLRTEVTTPLAAFVAGEGADLDLGILFALIGGAGVVDHRALGIYVRALERHPAAAATALLLHGDSRVLPALQARLARVAPVGDDDAWCNAILGLTHAIEELGGVLDERDLRRELAAFALDRVLHTRRFAEHEAPGDDPAGGVVTHEDPRVRVWIAANAHAQPPATIATLTYLATDPDPSVRLAVATASGASDEIVRGMIHDSIAKVAAAARDRLERKRPAAQPPAPEAADFTDEPTAPHLTFLSSLPTVRFT